MRIQILILGFKGLSYRQILTKLTAISVEVSTCQQSNSQVQACLKRCCFVTAKIVFCGVERFPHPPYPLHVCLLPLIHQCDGCLGWGHLAGMHTQICLP